jgi:hypothetical protein
MLQSNLCLDVIGFYSCSVLNFENNKVHSIKQKACMTEYIYNGLIFGMSSRC